MTGNVPDHLREELSGLQSTADNDVAGEYEDSNPLNYAGEVIAEDQEGEDDGVARSRKPGPTTG